MSTQRGKETSEEWVQRGIQVVGEKRIEIERKRSREGEK